MTPSIDVQVTFARNKESGSIVHISEVQRGDACNCVCLECGRDLQARKGDKRQYHFKHIIGTECNGETTLHLLAKKILIGNRQLALPGQSDYFSYSDVIEENALENIRPDIILISGDGKLLIEVAVTSFVDEIKLEKIKALDYNTVEIDLSSLPRDCSYQILEEIIIHQLRHKKIIHWKNASEGNTESPKGIYLLLFFLVIILGWLGLSQLKSRKLRALKKYSTRPLKSF